MRCSFDSTNRVQASNEILPSNSHVDAMFNGWPSRSRYKKNVSPQERERIRSGVDIGASLCFALIPCSSPYLRGCSRLVPGGKRIARGATVTFLKPRNRRDYNPMKCTKRL